VKQKSTETHKRLKDGDAEHERDGQHDPKKPTQNEHSLKRSMTGSRPERGEGRRPLWECIDGRAISKRI